MYISHNSSAIRANNALTRADNRLTSSLQKLSSGLKIVNPKDNPSGLAMAKRMDAQISGVRQANNNSSDGISVIEIADGTLSEITEMLQRMNQLAVKAATGSITEDDRALIDTEMQQLKEEITRISKETSFNGQPILDGSFDLRGYTDDVNTKVAYYSDDAKYGKYDITGLNVSFDADGTISGLTGIPTVAFRDDTTFPGTITETAFEGNTLTLRNNSGFELKLEIFEGCKSNVTADLVGFGAMDTQIGANEGQQLAIRIPKMSLENMSIANIKVTADYDTSGDVLVSGQDYANIAIGKLKDALKYVSAARSNLGAYQNRLEHTTSALAISEESLTGAYSRIMDVDMAEEMTEYTTLQVLTQASTSMLAQANERPSQVLQLLQ